MDIPYIPYHCEQRSDEWKELRRGILTGSKMAQWLVNRSNKRDKLARENAICYLLARYSGAWEKKDRAENVEWVKRGREFEGAALEAFEIDAQVETRPLGFARSKFGRFGCSPDGLIVGANSGVEIKVPEPETHIFYRRAGVLPEKYKYQVHGCMAVTGADSWFFYSFNPNEDGDHGLVPLLLEVKRDHETEELHDALIEFSGELDAAIENEKKRFQEMMDRREAYLKSKEAEAC